MTEELFRDDAYAKECTATVAMVNERGGIVLDRTVFYPTGGGQPGDSGVLRLSDGTEIEIVTTVKMEEGIVHVPVEGAAAPAPGSRVTASIDWDRRYRHMRMHTALHLLCAVVPYGVTGGKIGAEKSRLDFDAGEARLDKEEITAALNRLVAENKPTRARWITDDELDAQPDLIRTMSVRPPQGAGRVRLLEIEGTDLQPCGGTHVARTGEIGRVRVAKIESKGRRNRRISIVLED